MTFRILCTYETGNSFNKEQDTDYIPITWEKIEVARDSLRRVAEHYRAFRAIHTRSYCRSQEEKAEQDKALKEASTKEWYVDVYGEIGGSIIIKTDNGKDYQFWPPWIGYFERLFTAEIVSDHREDRMVFS